MGAVIAGVAEDRLVHALEDGFQQVLQRIQSTQEALLAQDRRVEEKFRVVERTMQEDRQATAAHANDALPHGVEVRLQRIEQRMEEMERSLLSKVGGGIRVSEAEGRLNKLEYRVQDLDASTKRTLQSVLSGVAALLNQQEKPSLHPTTSASASTSGAASAASAAGSAASPPLTPWRRKELDEQLFYAAKEGRDADVRRLLAEGADVNASSLPTTPLMIAAYSSQPHIVSLLIKMGADVNAKDRNLRCTALHTAATNDKSGICASLLIRAGALLDCANIDGDTALHLAAKEQNEAVVLVLVSAGASKSARECYGLTPADFAPYLLDL